MKIAILDDLNEGSAKNGGRRVIFVSGDGPEPKTFFSPIYLGGLVTGGRLLHAGGPLVCHDLVDFGYCMSSEHFGPRAGNLREYLAHLV